MQAVSRALHRALLSPRENFHCDATIPEVGNRRDLPLELQIDCL